MSGDDADLELAAGKALARLTILEWEGVGDTYGNPLPVTPEGINSLLDVWDIWLTWSQDVMSTFLAMESEKKRLCALAEWEFGGGAGYCGACAGTCADCPGQLNQPRTLEGWQVWDLITRLYGQLRIAPPVVSGIDLGAALVVAGVL